MVISKINNKQYSNLANVNGVGIEPISKVNSVARPSLGPTEGSILIWKDYDVGRLMVYTLPDPYNVPAGRNYMGELAKDMKYWSFMNDGMDLVASGGSVSHYKSFHLNQSFRPDSWDGTSKDSGISDTFYGYNGYVPIPDDRYLYSFNSHDGEIYKYEMSTPGDITTMTKMQTMSYSQYYLSGFHISNDGYTMVILNNGNNSVEVYELSSSHDLTSKSIIQTVSATDLHNNADDNVQGFRIMKNGTKFLINWYTGNEETLQMYNLGTAYDFTTEVSQWTDTSWYNSFWGMYPSPN